MILVTGATGFVGSKIMQIPIYLAKAAGARKLICFSSDQVYNGVEDMGPYTEDKVNPVNTYAKHKLLMEQKVLDICPDAVMLRAEWMYDYSVGNSNYFMKVINAKDTIAYSSSQYRGITYVREVVDNIGNVLSMPGGSFNYGSETTKSMYEITREFIDYMGLNLKLQDLPPRWNLWMDCSKVKKYGVRFSDVNDALMKCAMDNRFV